MTDNNQLKLQNKPPLFGYPQKIHFLNNKNKVKNEKIIRFKN